MDPKKIDGIKAHAEESREAAGMKQPPMISRDEAIYAAKRFASRTKTPADDVLALIDENAKLTHELDAYKRASVRTVAPTEDPNALPPWAGAFGAW